MDCGLLIAGALLLTPPALMSWAILSGIKETNATQKMLRSRITGDTPISGFYGPGGWWAFLITLGISHGHTIMTILRTGQLPSESWDYDLIGASSYVVAAAIDLIHKSRTVAGLGDKACESVLLPALLCAERVVSVGTGSSLFSLAIAYPCGGLFRLRTIPATISLIFALIASFFCLRAHEALSCTEPGIWYMDSRPPREWVVLTFAEVPASSAQNLVYKTGIPPIYLSPRYWLVVGMCSGVVAILVFVVCLVQRHNLRRALWWTACAALITPVILSLIPMFCLATWVAFLWCELAIIWVLLWWPVYILAYFPQQGFFPLTATSVFEMDQIAALLGIAVVAAIRTLRVIFKIFHSRGDLAPEGIPLLPLSSSDGTTDNP
ncbi:hypothetical protein C8R45DRAFT_402688 [Mycena sanguinolenta]|nr:hypothetical protein C8R45DRAFT_402688 [Mycena sanguinolenta]